MLARDQQKPGEGAIAVADSAVDNPALDRQVSHAPPTGRALREVEGSELGHDAIFLGADALALVQMKTVTLHSLTDAAAPPVLLVDNSAGSTLVSSAASPDGAALCLGDTAGWLAVFDVTALRAEPLSAPRHEARLGTAIAGVAFTDDGGRLLTMYASGPVEVRDARAEGLPPLRVLVFRGPQNQMGSCNLRCAGGVAVAVGGGVLNIAPGAESRRARVWRLDADGETEVATLELPAFASAATVRGDGGQVAVGGADGVVRLFSGEGWARSAELAEPGDGTHVASLAYTGPYGRQLVVGRLSDAFVVYNVGSGVAIARFAESTSNMGWVAAVAPAAAGHARTLRIARTASNLVSTVALGN
jgi:WD40 repeat protein